MTMTKHPSAVYALIPDNAINAIVADAINARNFGESWSWKEADAYAELYRRGWTQQKIADRCETDQPHVSVYLGCAKLYGVPHKRPSFWTAYAEVTGEKKRDSDDMEIHYSKKTAEWETPQDLFDALNAEFGFTLDVCATAENAKCKRYFTKEDDGLTQEWSGVCWMNPPYGDDRWSKKAYESAEAGATVVCLIPGRLDTAAWWEYYAKGEIRFLRGRLKFGGSENPAPFPSAVVIFPCRNPTVLPQAWWKWQRD